MAILQSHSFTDSFQARANCCRNSKLHPNYITHTNNTIDWFVVLCQNHVLSEEAGASSFRIEQLFSNNTLLLEYFSVFNTIIAKIYAGPHNCMVIPSLWLGVNCASQYCAVVDASPTSKWSKSFAVSLDFLKSMAWKVRNETLLVFRLEILSWIETLTFMSWLVLARYASLVMVCEGWSN